MWVLTTFFALATILLAWLCAGYFIALCFAGFLRRRPKPVIPAELPTISIIVPFYNEAGLLLDKLQNLLAIDYPSELLEVVFVDGGSTDGGLECLRSAIPHDRDIRLSLSPRRGKTHQLNHALPTLAGELVLNTDADGRLRPDALKHIAAEFAADPAVSVVGAYSYAASAVWRDLCFWDSQNRGRLIETDAHSSSIVIATCYAFRHDLLSEFPPDVVADDVYVGFLANCLGRRVIYSRTAIVEEVRAPRGISEFLSHKFRKNNAFLRESLRFLYRLPEMSGFCKLMSLTRIAQQLLIPWAAFLWAFLALTLLTLGRIDILIIASASLALSIMIASQAFQSVEVPPNTTRRYGIIKQALVFFDTMFVLFAAALTYPFYRQDSSFTRLADTASNPREDPARTSTASMQIERPPFTLSRHLVLRTPPSSPTCPSIHQHPASSSALPA